MIDVVFLLLVFFMLAARFGQTGAVPITPGATGTYAGPPRLVDVAPEGLRLNGQEIAVSDLPTALAALTTAPSDPIVLRPLSGADLQQLVDVLTALGAAGFTGLSVVEGPDP